MSVLERQAGNCGWGDLLGLRMRLRRDLRLSFGHAGEAAGFLKDPEQRCTYALSPWQCRFLMSLDRAEVVSAAVRTVIRDFPETATRQLITGFMNWLREKRFLTELASPLQSRGSIPRRIPVPEIRPNSPPVLFRIAMNVVTVIVVAAGIWKLNPSLQSSFPVWRTSELSINSAEIPAERASIPLIASCAGVLSEVLVQDGDKVEAGDLVARIEDPREVASLERLRQELGECRLRRDRFYQERDRRSYINELQRMATISREIGGHQASVFLAELRAPAAGEVITGHHCDQIGSWITEGDVLLRVRLRDSEPDSGSDLLANAR